VPVIEIVDERASANVRELRLASPAMGRAVSATVLTPPGWRPGGCYPVLYLLHGSSDDHHCWLRHTAILDMAAESGFLVVLPEAGRIGFYTDWEVPDRDATVPRWETFHTVELVALLEERFCASDVRLAAGISMGGYGALRYAIRRPGLFRAVASLSGLVHLTRPGIATLLTLLALRERTRPGRIWGPRRRCHANWAANDPFLHADDLRGTRVFLSAGDGTRLPGDDFVPGMGRIERGSRAANEEFATRLLAVGADVTTHFTAGTHFWPTWRRHLAAAWPWLVNVSAGTQR